MSSLENTSAMDHAIGEVNDEIYEKKEYLTMLQLDELADCFMLPFNGIDIVIDSINKQIRWLTYVMFEDIPVYPGIFQEFKEKLKKTYWSTLLEPGTGIGAVTSDAIGQQATQALLNTFHSVGTAKSGGPDGIKENITLSANRKILYSILHMKNARMTFAEMMAYKKKYIGITVSDLLINPEQSGKSLVVNIIDEIKNDPFSNSISPEEKMKIFNSKRSWWYSRNNFTGVVDFNSNVQKERTCLRLQFDLQKLYEYRITTSKIANIINKYSFEVTLPKKGVTKSGTKTATKREVEKRKVYAAPSPTYIGIVDIFVMSISDNEDHMLINLIHSKQFKSIIISGIDGINNFYAVSTGITRLMRDVGKTSRFDENPVSIVGKKEKKPKKGMWLYLENNRFLGIPYSRIISALDKAGIKYEIPHYNVENSYNDKFTDLPFEYHSHKNIPELRTSMKLRAYLFGGMTEHVYPSYSFTNFHNNSSSVTSIKPDIDHYKSEVIGRGFDVVLYPYSSANSYDGLISTKKFKSKEEFVSFVSMLDYRISKEHFEQLFRTNDPVFNTFFDVQGTEMKLIAFEITHTQPGTEATLDAFGNVTVPAVPEVTSIYYLIYYMFQMQYIDYQITTNLDYCNSRYVTQSLDSVLGVQFTIPYNISNGGGNVLPEALRTYKIRDVVTMDKPEKRIFIKTRMFLKDMYDFINVANRKVIKAFLHKSDKDSVDEEKEKLTVKIADDLNETIDGVSSFLDFCMSNGIVDTIQDGVSENMFALVTVTKLKRTAFDLQSNVDKEAIKMWDTSIRRITTATKVKPFDRFISFLSKKLTENDLNYVYAETSGCNFNKALRDPLVEGHRTVCNHFIQVYDALGLEGMKNCQNHDLIGMVNSSGYISVEYMNFLTTVTTFNGRNPMTSSGVSGQNNRDWLSMATFNSAAVFVKKAAIEGREQSAESTSTCIVLGKKFKTGTGFVNITVDKTKLTVSTRQTGISEKFIQLSGVVKPVGDLFLDDSTAPIYIPDVEVGKFPVCPWVYDNFITRDIVFYIQQGIENTLKARISPLDVIDCNSLPNLDDLFFNIVPTKFSRRF